METPLRKLAPAVSWKLERSAGIAPASPGWHPGILLLNDDREERRGLATSAHPRRIRQKRTNTAASRALQLEHSTHPLDLLGGSFGVYRHTSHEAFIVKTLAWDWFILSTGLLLRASQFVDTPHLWRNLVLGYDSSGCTILLLSDQSRLDAGSRRHRGILFHRLNLSCLVLFLLG